MDDLQQDWDRQSELLERILDGESVDDVLASEPDPAVREAVLSMLHHHREAEKTGFLDAPPTLVRALHEGTDGPSLKGGERLNDRFVILRHIGSGGMGEVYLARDEVMNDDVALKIIRPELSEDPRIRTRFIAEVRNARRVTHTNVCHVYDIVERAELPFFTMEYLPGRTLAEALGSGSLDGAAKKRIAAQLANGLDAAHLRGIIHRDFKPANVMLTERNGRLDAVIMDFGLARTEEMTDPGNAHSLQAGTEEYMAPELLQGSKATLQSDVYAYGKVLQQLLPNHPLLSKLLAERPEERQPSLRAVIASFDEANGKATRRTWMLGTAAAAATGYAGWKAIQPATKGQLTRQMLLMNSLSAVNATETVRSSIEGLLFLALAQSPLLSVIAREQLVTELKKHGFPQELPAQQTVLQRLASTKNNGRVLTGEVTRSPRGVALRMRLIGTFDNSEKTFESSILGHEKLFRLVNEVSLLLRQEIGESAFSIKKTYSPVEEITSSSVEAVQFYFEAVQKYEDADAIAAEALLDQALKIDPNFVLAHHYKALALGARSQHQEAIAESKIAFGNRWKVSDRERYWIEAIYYSLVSDPVRALEAYKANATRFPEDAVFQRQLALGYSAVGEFAAAIEHNKAALKIDPFSENNRSELIVNLAEAMRYDEAIQAHQSFRDLGDTSSLLNWGASLAFLGKDDCAKSEELVKEMGSTPERRRWARLLLVGPTILSGRWEEAISLLEQDINYDEVMQHYARKKIRHEWAAWTCFSCGLMTDATRHANEVLSGAMLSSYCQSVRSVGLIGIVIDNIALAKRAHLALGQMFAETASTKIGGMAAAVGAMVAECEGRFSVSRELARRAIGLWPDFLNKMVGVWTSEGVRDGDELDGILAGMLALRGSALRREWPGWQLVGIVITADKLARKSESDRAVTLCRTLSRSALRAINATRQLKATCQRIRSMDQRKSEGGL